MKRLMVTASVAGLYESDKEGALLADELLCGTGAELLQRHVGGILRVRAAHGYEGFVASENLAPEDAQWQSSPKLIVTGSYVNLQQQPLVRSTVLFSLPRGSLCKGEGPSVEGWQPVCLAGGQRGYLQTVHLDTYPLGAGLADNALRRSLCNNALAYLGCCYRWGGKTPLGIDCSGLCSQVYLNHGITIYRDARIVEGYPVREIPREVAGGQMTPLQPADLLYWKGHMALWLGEGRYIHSSASAGGVTVNSLIKGGPGYREDLATSILAYGTALQL